MFINVSNNLPKTSYMKMIDIWLLFNLIYPFSVVLIHTYMDTLRNDEMKISNNDMNKDVRAKKLHRAQKMSRVSIPGILLISSILYWIIGLKHADAI